MVSAKGGWLLLSRKAKRRTESTKQIKKLRVCCTFWGWGLDFGSKFPKQKNSALIWNWSYTAHWKFLLIIFSHDCKSSWFMHCVGFCRSNKTKPHQNDLRFGSQYTYVCRKAILKSLAWNCHGYWKQSESPFCNTLTGFGKLISQLASRIFFEVLELLVWYSVGGFKELL